MVAPKPKPKPARDEPCADVLRHLADSLKVQWKRYRKKLKRCQQDFSVAAVHDSRVETRRLLATIELLGALLPERDLTKARRALKRHLDTFDELRDTQVQLDYVGRMMRMFPAARAFREWLLKREARFTRETRNAIKRVKTRRLGRRVAAFEQEIRRLRHDTARDAVFSATLAAMHRAFARVAQLCRRVKARDTRTIHRTRIAFKRFRYMVEALSTLLPAVTDQHRQALRGYQSMMGDIQDVEVLLAAFRKFNRKKATEPAAARMLYQELLRRRQSLIQVYLNAASKLRQFWPPPGLIRATRHPKQTRATP